uniref:Kringle-containing protein marking the eye and the nose n=1 Tax=Hucho hucho TaxID=62062 RepID=A0A4W5R027_9TELE
MPNTVNTCLINYLPLPLSPSPECYTANGEDYRGCQNQTSLLGGKPCLFWNETFQHPYNTLKYPNGEGGLGSHNYCRNPDGDVQPWCYIADHEDGIYWRYCDIPTCQMPGNLGCFKDSGDPPTLTGSSQTSNKLTIQNCISFCRKQRYTLAGMESGYACFCGNDLDLRRHGKAPSMECNHVCFGDHTQPCGGDGWVIVFDTKYITIQISSVILFNFTFFDISDQTDMVELLDGYTNQVVARFDGRTPPREVVNVTGDFVILYFYSDRTNQAQGFAVTYQGGFTHTHTHTHRQTHTQTHTDRTNQTQGKFYVSVLTEWTIYTLAALLTLTVIVMVTKLLLHITIKSPNIPTISGSESCSGQSSGSEPWIILYRPSTISLFKKKLKNHHGDLSPLVGN